MVFIDSGGEQGVPAGGMYKRESNCLGATAFAAAFGGTGVYRKDRSLYADDLSATCWTVLPTVGAMGARSFDIKGLFGMVKLSAAQIRAASYAWTSFDGGMQWSSTL